MKPNVVIPALNEEAIISHVSDRVSLRLSLTGLRYCHLRFNGDDEDVTRQKSLENDAVVLSVKRQGKGPAMQLAFAPIRADYFVMSDGRLLAPARTAAFAGLLGAYDVAIGSRIKGRNEGCAMTRINVFGHWVLAGVARMLFRKDITDLCTGFWGCREYVVDRTDLVAQRFKIEADMFIECAHHGFDTGETAINYGERTDRPGLSLVSNGLKNASFSPKRHMTQGGGRAL